MPVIAAMPRVYRVAHNVSPKFNASLDQRDNATVQRMGEGRNGKYVRGLLVHTSV